MERLSIKIGKAELDIKFLRHCKIILYQISKLPYADQVYSRFIRKRLGSALNKRQDELKKLEEDHVKILQTLSMKLLSVDLYIYWKDVLDILNVGKAVYNVISTHEKRLKNLTKNTNTVYIR